MSTPTDPLHPEDALPEPLCNLPGHCRLAIVAHTAAAVQRALAAQQQELQECDELRRKLSDLLRRTAVALRGPEPALTRWSWHDLPERAAAAIAAIDVMQRAAVAVAQQEHGK
jgi:hypothetical protein